MEELATKFDHKSVEEGKYENWIKKGYFTAGDKSKDPFTIVIPPPNVTGILHIGHALDNTLQDVIARYKRLKGYDMLYLPGMDHAGIATQAKVDARLKDEGISRYDIGREKFLERAWQWKEEYAATIRKQWEKLGNSLDYTRERFTMDDGFNDAVKHVFVSLYNEGLIYRGWRIINWDPEAKTALSNIEVYYQEDAGKMYYMYYYTVEDNEKFIVATTRPETMFGDVCVVVNPNDQDNNHLIGKHCINPANGQQLPIIGDDYIEIGFGTGIMKCTPAHDPNDYQIAQRHGLDMPICMNPDGTMNDLCGKYEGMDRYDAREELVKQFINDNVIDHIEDIKHEVAHSERTHCVVEPYLSQQWFVKMKPLADDVLKNQQIENQKINFYPPRFEKTFNQWLENIEDWCISRQLWWGHRIPAWYNKQTGETYVGEQQPADIENWEQDEDVLDTWFSSALWPFATLGWPQDNADLQRYYPTSTMVTGYDIIFFWVARMAFQSRHFTNNRPFKDVIIHGLVRDEQGRKMSKSLGNGIDPMAVIDQYGVDALRFFLATNSTLGLDMRYSNEKVEAAWNFINKIWNASRYVLLNTSDCSNCELPEKLNAIDSWILDKYNTTLQSVSANMEKYEFGLAGNELYSFIWDDFCSWYIELSKANLNSENETVRNSSKQTLLYMLNVIVKMLSPFTPFVAEEIYLHLPAHKESINLETYPVMVNGIDSEDVATINKCIEIISKIREAKVNANAKPSLALDAVLKDNNGNLLKDSETLSSLILKIAKVTLVDSINGEVMVIPTTFGSIELDNSALVNKEEQINTLNKQITKLQAEIKRGEGMLSNTNFISKAPQAKIDQEKEKLANYKAQYELVLQRLQELQGK